jgi:hypothetical protein
MMQIVQQAARQDRGGRQWVRPKQFLGPQLGPGKERSDDGQDIAQKYVQATVALH